MKLGLIVEGHGEVKGAPALVRRLVAEAYGPVCPPVELEIPEPFRLPRGKMLKPEELRRAVHFMMRKTSPDRRVLVLLDADDDCPGELGPRLLASAPATEGGLLSVVIAKREFEAWFLGAAESLRGKRGLAKDVARPDDPETIRDAKGWLDARMATGYRETLHQPSFAAMFDWRAVQGLSSFDKLLRELRRLTATTASSPASGK